MQGATWDHAFEAWKGLKRWPREQSDSRAASLSREGLPCHAHCGLAASKEPLIAELW